MPPRPTRHRVALALALAGIAVSVVSLVVHGRLVADESYTSFCNLGGAVNCDAVLGSRYGVALGVPVAAWGVAAFVAGALLVLPGALGAAAPLADLALIGVVSASLGFALALLGVSVVILGSLCLLCLATDVVVLAWFVTVAPLAVGESARHVATGPQRWGRAALTAGFLVSVLGGVVMAMLPSGDARARTASEVRDRDPKFYRWYTALPVQPVSGLTDPSSHRKGAADAPIAIVEFSDFQCPYCVQAARDLHDVMRSRPDVSLVFRHFPLDTACNGQVQRSLHPNACLAACAAECAGRQGRFWEYHDMLFENHDELERDSLFRYARDMQLDLGAFRSCLDDPATRARIGEDVSAGARAGVTSTPTLFINGRTVQGALPRAYYEYALILERNAHRHPPDGAS